MSQLTLALLGTPEIRHAGQLLTFPTRKAAALLMYLAVEAGWHSREKIATLFWPESDAARSRSTLRRTRAFLRQTLNETTEPVDRPHLLVERDRLGFNFASDFALDLRVLGSIPLPARSAADGSADLLPHLKSAADSYRGDFLEGFSLSDAPAFDDWVSVQREAWHRRMGLVYARLSQLQSDAGQVAAAIGTAARWVVHDPFDEAAHRCLMQLHFAAGDRAAALRAYDHCQAVLAAELEAAPAPETQALADHIRAAAPPRGQPVARSGQPMLAVEAPLVGRSAEHTQLVTAYRAACLGRSQVLTLEGEAGIGKSRLALEFLNWAAAQGALVLRGRAFESSGRLPYQPLIDALRSQLERENAPDDLLSDTWLAELSRLLPELRDRYPDLPAPAPEEAAAPSRLFEAVARLGKAWADRAPLVLFIDDVQWADAGSLDLLQYVTRRWAEMNAPIMLLPTVRAEALVTLPALIGWLSSLSRDLPTTRLTLSPLTPDDTTQLIRSLAKRTPDEARAAENEFSQWLFAETRGQPFYMLETLKALLEQEVLKMQRDTAGGWTIDFEFAARDRARLRGYIPPRVRDVIRARLARLSPTASTLLAAGAVLGHGFTFERMCRTTDISEQAGLPGLDELLTSQLLIEADQTADRPYTFAHDKIRDVVYTEAGDARRRIFHRRALEALEYAAAPVAALAHHRSAAGLAEPAFRHSLAAGDDALRVFAVRDAIDHYERARHVLMEQASQREDVEFSEESVLRLFVQLGHAYQLSGELDRARDVYEAMLKLAHEAQWLELECAALNRLATFTAQMTLDMDKAAELLQQALIAAERSGNKTLSAETEWNLAQMSFYRWDGRSTLTHGERALALARELSNQELIARCMNVIAYAYTALGRWPECEAAAQEGRALYLELNSRAMEADCLAQIASARINCGRPREGVEAARVSFDVSGQVENGWGQANAAIYLSRSLLEIGEYTEALKIAQQGVATARAIKHDPMLALNLVRLGCAHRVMLDLEGALAAHHEAEAISAEASSPIYAEIIPPELCADYVLAGDWNEAHRYAVQAIAARDYSLQPSVLTRWHEIEALIHAGQIDRAVEEVRRVGEAIGDNRRYRLAYLRARAVLAQAREERKARDEASHCLQEAARLATEIRLPGELWPIEIALGRLYQSSGDDDLARASFARAAETVRSLADHIDDESLRAQFLKAAAI